MLVACKLKPQLDISSPLLGNCHFLDGLWVLGMCGSVGVVLAEHAGSPAFSP